MNKIIDFKTGKVLSEVITAEDVIRKMSTDITLMSEIGIKPVYLIIGREEAGLLKDFFNTMGQIKEGFPTTINGLSVIILPEKNYCFVAPKAHLAEYAYKGIEP